MSSGQNHGSSQNRQGVNQSHNNSGGAGGMPNYSGYSTNNYGSDSHGGSGIGPYTAFERQHFGHEDHSSQK